MEIYHEKSHKRNNNVSENQKFYILKVETIELFIAETCIESYWIRWHLRIFIVFKELKLYILEHLINQFTTFQFFPLKTRQQVCISCKEKEREKEAFETSHGVNFISLFKFWEVLVFPFLYVARWWEELAHMSTWLTHKSLISHSPTTSNCAHGKKSKLLIKNQKPKSNTFKQSMHENKNLRNSLLYHNFEIITLFNLDFRISFLCIVLFHFQNE